MVDEVNSYRKFGGCCYGLDNRKIYYKLQNQNCNKKYITLFLAWQSAIAPDEFYDELIAWAKKHNIIVVHDNAYSDIIYDGNIGGSFLSHEGAKDVGIEFFSLSKSFNLTGARVSFAIGNKEVVAAIKNYHKKPFDLSMLVFLYSIIVYIMRLKNSYNF